jgi:S1-C subfamily serine protease
LGIIPDYTDSPEGLRIQGVLEGSPAEKAGLRSEDIIVQIGSMRISSIYDLMQALQSYSPGDTATVEVLRNGTRQRFTVRFEHP